MKSPKEIVGAVNATASYKCGIETSRLVLLAFLAGVYISMGGLLSVVVGAEVGALIGASSALVKVLGSFVFPVGLIVIVIAGGELFTSNCAYLAPNLLAGRSTMKDVLRNWTIVWCVNFVGALFFAYFITYLTDISSSENVKQAFFNVAKSKTSYDFIVVFLRGIGANWFVCLAIWVSLSATTVSGKIIGIWFLIMAFVAIGFEHSIANMYMLPVAMMEGYELSVVDLFAKNLIPVTLGNIVGGFLFVGAAYWYVYDKE
ncbi:MAG: formate/nitrite transporter family protein [Rikenellaceae bacterium]